MQTFSLFRTESNNFVSSVLKFVQVTQHRNSAICCKSLSKFVVTWKFVKVYLIIVQVFDEDDEQYGTQHWTLGYSAHYCQPSGWWAIDHHNSGLLFKTVFSPTLLSDHPACISLVSKWKWSGNQRQRKIKICIPEIKLSWEWILHHSLASFPINPNSWHSFLFCFLRRLLNIFLTLLLWRLPRQTCFYLCWGSDPNHQSSCSHLTLWLLYGDLPKLLSEQKN